MKVEVTKSFLWAPDGNHVRTVAVGELLEGRGAEVALQLGSGYVLAEASKAEETAEPKPTTPEVAHPAVEPAPAPAPAPADRPARGRGKGR